MKTYCVRCDRELYRLKNCSRVVCVSEFCQGRMAQCQKCKTELSLFHISCNYSGSKHSLKKKSELLQRDPS